MISKFQCRFGRPGSHDMAEAAPIVMVLISRLPRLLKRLHSRRQQQQIGHTCRWFVFLVMAAAVAQRRCTVELWGCLCRRCRSVVVWVPGRWRPSKHHWHVVQEATGTPAVCLSNECASLCNNSWPVQSDSPWPVAAEVDRACIMYMHGGGVVMPQDRD